jgi:hypothetical protein
MVSFRKHPKTPNVAIESGPGNGESALVHDLGQGVRLLPEEEVRNEQYLCP